MIEELMIEENVLKKIIREMKNKNVSGCIKQLLIYQTHEKMEVCPKCTQKYGCRRNYLKVIK